MRSRKNILEDIIKYENPESLPILREELNGYPWDSEEVHAVLSRKSIVNILERFARGEITARQVEDWADALEIRDDVEFGENNDEETILVMSELANPVQPLTVNEASAYIESLRTSPYSY